MKHHIFISYSRTDTEIMHRISAALRRAELTVWTDEGIEPGTPSWKQAIQSAISNTGCLICILSPEAAGSRWVREELDFADIQQKPIYLVHVRGDELEVALFGFVTSQRVDVRDADDYDIGIDPLIEAIRKSLGLDANAQPPTAATIRHNNRGQFFYPNYFARNTIEALAEIMGASEREELLTLADLADFIDRPPPNNMKKEFDFADFAALNAVLDEKYGPSGGEALKRSVGRATFLSGLKKFGGPVGIGAVTFKAFKAMPIETKIKVGLSGMASTFSRFSDQVSNVYDAKDHFIYTMERCPMCWGHQTNRAVCHLGQGLLQEGLIWASGGHKFNVDVCTCIAKGDDIGRYVIHKEPVSE